MIVLKKEDLNDQAGMERAFRGYFVDAARAFPEQFNTMLGAELYECDYENSTVTLVMEPKPWMGNPMGILHGGVTASALDMTMGLLCRYCSGGLMTPTISMDVQYLRAGGLDERLFIRAELAKRGMSICYAVGSIWAESTPERKIAQSSGSYYVTGRIKT